MISLEKGQKINLDKDIKNFIIGLGWDERTTEGGAFDLDASCFLLNKNNKITRDEDFIFYNNLEHPSKAVNHMGDDRTGGSSVDSDDEQIKVCLDKVPSEIEKIVVVVTIHKAEERKQNFGQVKNAYVRILALDGDTEDEKYRFDLTEDYSIETAMTMCEIYRHQGSWKVAAVGQGYKQGLDVYVRQYGGEC